MVSSDATSTTVEIFLPVARFAGHVAASAVGFIALGVVALIPVYLVKLLIWVGGPTQLIELFSRVEIAVLYVDICLYGSFVGFCFPDRGSPRLPQSAGMVGGRDDRAQERVPQRLQRRLGSVFLAVRGSLAGNEAIAGPFRAIEGNKLVTDHMSGLPHSRSQRCKWR
jgi:hypothetical protein